MKLLFTFLLLTLGLHVSAQRKSGKILFEPDCPQYEYCKDCGDSKAVFTGKLKNYFEKQLNFRDFDLVEGVIVVKVAVDSLGQACAHQFYNYTTNTSEEINRLKLDWLIHIMPKWQPAMVNGQPVNSFVLLALYSKVDKHSVFDVNYLRNDKEKKWQVNSKNESIVIDPRALETNLDN